MFICHADAVVWTLKFSVWPALTLMAVAKPWMVESPELLSFQSLGGSPGCVFSQATGLTTGGPHGPPAAATRSTWSTTVHTVVVKTVANIPTIAGNRLIRNMPNLPPRNASAYRFGLPDSSLHGPLPPRANAPGQTRLSLFDWKREAEYPHQND